MAARTLRQGAVYRFRLTATKDGATWDLSTATVTLRFTKPDGTQVDKSATAYDPTSGLARYDCATSDLDQTGEWRRVWRVVDGTVTLPSDPILFLVEPTP